VQSIIYNSDLFKLSYFQWFLSFLGVFLLGLSKSGIKGVGVVIVLLLAFIFGGKSSTGILIPMMILADVFAVIYYHRHTQWKLLIKLLPSMVVGVLIGVWFGNDISEQLFKQIMAVFILATVVIMLIMERKKNKNIPTNKLFSNGMGLLSGITSMIGNLAGAFASIYFLAMRLPKNEFIGTAAWLFFIINIFKLPFHIFIWKTVSKETILLNIILVPGVILGFFVGIQLVKLIHNDLYRKFILAVTAVGAITILLS
jgi:uncharacterized membrane protein YfcA